MEKSNKAIFNLQRFQILYAKLNPATSELISDEYAYAWYNNLYPILDNDQLHEDLEEYFSITKEQVDIITKYADSESKKEQYHTFYEYEDYFNVREYPVADIDRNTLISTFRYFYLKRTFNQTFWETLLKPMEHPVEAKEICSKFSIDELYLL